MIANWIAKAVMTGETELLLDKAQLSQWHVQGCRVYNGSPYNTWGPYAMAQLGRVRMGTESRLQAMPVEEWPTGFYNDWKPHINLTARFPPLEYTQAGPDAWRVPLIAKDPGHALNAWSFDLCLSQEEMDALRPLSLALTERCLLTSYRKTFKLPEDSDLPWDASRIQLALLAGLNEPELKASFVIARAMRTPADQPRVPFTLTMVRARPHAQLERS